MEALQVITEICFSTLIYMCGYRLVTVLCCLPGIITSGRFVLLLLLLLALQGITSDGVVGLLQVVIDSNYHWVDKFLPRVLPGQLPVAFFVLIYTTVALFVWIRDLILAL